MRTGVHPPSNLAGNPPAGAVSRPPFQTGRLTAYHGLMMRTHMVQPVTALDYRRLAKRRLPRYLFDYIDGGANDETTLRANEADFREICLRQSVLRDVSSVSTETTLCGQPSAMPLALAPVGLAGMMARRGETQAARAAGRAGVPFSLSTVGICPLEEVQAAATGPVWFQLYKLRERPLVVKLLRRAQEAGCKTLLFTVDLAAAGMRHRDLRNGMLGTGLHARVVRAWRLVSSPRWVWDVGIRGRPHEFGNLDGLMSGANKLDAYKAFIGSQFDASATWKDIAWLRTQWSGSILIKGVMCAEDAREAVNAGADGVIVSNHGGRQLDGAPSTITRLPEVVSEVGDRTEVYLDGGVRSGIDVVRAVALGARAVLIGRPWVWAVAARGEAGLSRLLAVFQQEIATAMALMGVTEIPGLGEKNITRRRASP